MSRKSSNRVNAVFFHHILTYKPVLCTLVSANDKHSCSDGFPSGSLHWVYTEGSRVLNLGTETIEGREVRDEWHRGEGLQQPQRCWAHGARYEHCWKGVKKESWEDKFGLLKSVPASPDSRLLLLFPLTLNWFWWANMVLNYDLKFVFMKKCIQNVVDWIIGSNSLL